MPTSLSLSHLLSSSIHSILLWSSLPTLYHNVFTTLMRISTVLCSECIVHAYPLTTNQTKVTNLGTSETTLLTISYTLNVKEFIKSPMIYSSLLNHSCVLFKVNEFKIIHETTYDSRVFCIFNIVFKLINNLLSLVFLHHSELNKLLTNNIKWHLILNGI